MATKALFRSAAAWTGVGLVGGLAYREITKHSDFTGHTELSVIHTHALTLGTVALLLVLMLTQVFRLPREPLFRWFTPVWNAGLAITLLGQAIIGYRQVQGEGAVPALAGIAGLGHILLTAAFIILFVVLGRRLQAQADGTDAVQA